MQELFCNTTNKCDEGDGANSDAGHASRAQAHLQPAPWPFGPGYVSQLAHHYGKQDGRGQHNVGKADTSKFAPKNPKAGKPLPGNRAPKGLK